MDNEPRLMFVYEQNGAVHTGTKKFDFFPFTCGYMVKELYFLHHGRAVLNDFEGSKKRCENIFPNVLFCNDGEIFLW